MTSRTTRRMMIMIGCVILLIAGLAGGKYLQIRNLIADAPKPGAQTVSTMTVAPQWWQPQFDSVGSLVAVRGVNVTTESAGMVKTVEFRSGAEVEAGALLVQLNADADVDLLHSLQASAELSATTLKRDSQQLAARAISQAQVDNDMADLKVKHANVAQQAAVVARKTIRAPFSGRLGISTVSPGQYLNPGDKLVTLQTLDPIHVDFSLPQQHIGGLAVGQKVTVANDAFPGSTFDGTISAISPLVDSTTRGVQIEATLANPDHRLLPGMYARIAVEAGAKQEFLTLPQSAIAFNPYGATVFVVKASPAVNSPATQSLAVQQVFVTTGETRGDQVAVVTGLKAGEQVVTSGQLKLKSGTLVVIDNTVRPSNDPAPAPQER